MFQKHPERQSWSEKVCNDFVYGEVLKDCRAAMTAQEVLFCVQLYFFQYLDFGYLIFFINILIFGTASKNVMFRRMLKCLSCIFFRSICKKITGLRDFGLAGKLSVFGPN